MAAEGCSTVKPISASCQSIASTGNPSTSAGGGSLGSISGGIGIGGDGSTHYINGTGSLGRIRHHQQYQHHHYHHNHSEKQKSIDTSDDELDDSQATHIRESRVKSDRIAVTKEEDRRRRTIIVEKKNTSYGFTLQSYGIHYKKEKEVEMITYVDYVEYDGPAYRAGMREGDVILSINGTDMEKADHKTLVAFIKNCDTRMRMVVLFEDCARKVELHSRYIQLQNILQSKMNELERVCLRERELLDGKWKTHSLPARKKTTTSPSDVEAGISPTGTAVEAQQSPFYRPTLSTEDVVNIGRHQSHQTIIPPPAQFMLTYQYLDPSYRYVLKPSTSNSSGEYIISVGGGGGAGGAPLTRSPSDHHFILARAESTENAAVNATHYVSTQPVRPPGPPPVPPPRNCEKHQPNKLHVTEQHQQQKIGQNQQLKQQHQQNAHSHQTEAERQVAATKSHKSSGRHCHGHSCNPCVGHFGRKSQEKNGGGDNLSLDAYDLASPCCDSHCVPTRRRTRHHKEHIHKHKHRERDSKERSRPKSQSHVSPSANHHTHHHHNVQQQQPQQQQQQIVQQQQQHQHHHQHHHLKQQQQQQHSCDTTKVSSRSRYFDLTAGLASHCSLHSCTSSEFAPADSSASYTTSLSTDTLYWDPQSENTACNASNASRQHSTKSRQSYHQPGQQQSQQQTPHQSQQHSQQHPHGIYQQRYHIAATQVQPSQIYPNDQYVNKPKSWDNLTTKAIGGYGFGYGYLDTVAPKPPIKLQIAQQRHSIPRKNPYGRYSTYTDVENYAPPPSQFVEELTTTTTTTIVTKSTEDLITNPPPPPVLQPTVGAGLLGCDCSTKQANIKGITTTATSSMAQYHTSLNPKYSHHNNCRLGYYSHLPRPLTDVGTSMEQNGEGPAVATISEATRL